MELSEARVTRVEPTLSYQSSYPGGGLVCVDHPRDVWAVPLHDTETGEILMVRLTGMSIARLHRDLQNALGLAGASRPSNDGA